MQVKLALGHTMRLEVDIGNTLLKWRVIDAGNVIKKGSVLTQEFAHDSFGDVVNDRVDEVFVGSVAGFECDKRLRKVCRALWEVEPIFAKTSSQCAGVTNSYEDPSKMGVDRWLAMIAAYKRVNKAVIVVDCGSAVTVEYLSDKGEHLGGYIIPGLRLMRESLLKNTAQVRFEKQPAEIVTHPGVSTAEAVLQGSVYLFKALAYAIEGDLEKGAELFFTGGDGALMQEMIQVGRYESDLVMDGLAWVCR
ncbi:type III pantothenate kinase [Neptunomonas japonica]|nr:type III pantothenate kinase [Neptunomonas japonica]